jgi:hypothetical protein
MDIRGLIAKGWGLGILVPQDYDPIAEGAMREIDNHLC